MSNPRLNSALRMMEYQQQRRAVLLTLDPAKFMEFIDTHLEPVVRARLRACWQRDGDKFLLLVMHKIRSVLPDIPIEERDVSLLWLQEHGIEFRTREQMEDAWREGWPKDPDIP